MFRSCNFRNREVINIDTAERIGIVKDIEIDAESGNIKALIIKKHGGVLPLPFAGEAVIPWENIAVMGKDLVLVRFGNLLSC